MAETNSHFLVHFQGCGRASEKADFETCW